MELEQKLKSEMSYAGCPHWSLIPRGGTLVNVILGLCGTSYSHMAYYIQCFNPQIKNGEKFLFLLVRETEVLWDGGMCVTGNRPLINL